MKYAVAFHKPHTLRYGNRQRHLPKLHQSKSKVLQIDYRWDPQANAAAQHYAREAGKAIELLEDDGARYAFSEMALMEAMYMEDMDVEIEPYDTVILEMRPPSLPPESAMRDETGMHPSESTGGAEAVEEAADRLDAEYRSRPKLMRQMRGNFVMALQGRRHGPKPLL